MKPIAQLMKFLQRIVLLLVVVGLGIIFVQYYHVIFAKTVIGRIENVARVTELTAIIGSRPIPENQIYSFSVSIKQPDGELLTATTEDRQWAVAKSGLCAKAKYFPYPPWNLDKAGTYHSARLEALVDCESEAARNLGIDAKLYKGTGGDANLNAGSSAPSVESPSSTPAAPGESVSTATGASGASGATPSGSTH